MAVLATLYALLLYAATTLGGAVLLAVFGVPLALLPRGRREWLGMPLNQLLARFVMHAGLWLRLEVEGREHLPRSGSYLVIANHRSWLDVVVLVALARAHGISKKEVLYMPFLGLLGYLGGAVFFDRRDPAERKRARDEALFLLRRGRPLHLYPEGTRTRTGRLRERVHLALVRSCWREGIPVVPAALWGTDRAIPVQGFRVRLLQRVRVRFLPPEPLEAHDSDRAYARAAWARVVEEVHRFEAEESGGGPAGAAGAGAPAG